MAHYDVFNGDADGICALLQLRLANPVESTLITGVKRDIQLLPKVLSDFSIQSGDEITVLDISMDKNKQALVSALDLGAKVFYADHHFAGDIPTSAHLSAHINEAPDTCTSLIINGHLKGQYPEWAITGAFGDNLKNSAQAVAKLAGVSGSDLQTLENLGIYINYNGYGAALEDLHFTPADLYRTLSAFANPLEFVLGNQADFSRLEEGYQSDMANAEQTKPHHTTDHIAVFVLPDQSWARRVSGVYSNDLTNQYPDRAHTVVTQKSNGNYLVSVRAPLNNKQGAVDLCRQFPTGGGRAAAAGINDLPADQLDVFIARFSEAYSA